jgi:hypothetical protein
VGLIGVAGLVSTSCERLREFAEDVGGEVREVAEDGSNVDPGGAIAEPWQPLVDLGDTGYRFRHDLEFPDQLSVRLESSVEISDGRSFGRSVLGAGSVAVEGARERVVEFERDGSRVRVQVTHDRFVKPIIEGGGGETGEPEDREEKPEDSLEGVAATFIRLDDGWKRTAGEADFRVLAWASQLVEQLDRYLPETGVVPRSPWFGGKRMLPGAQLELSGSEIELVAGPGARGRLQLRFDRVENIGGHPCGVFHWSGDFTVDDAANLAGDREKLEMSVSEGQLWCSLVHPLILREESAGVMTVERRDPAGQLSMRLQGAVKIERSLRWTPAAD